MVTAHFATDAPLASPTHAFPYVDGMSAFVMLSGIVLGLVYQRWATRHGLRYAYVRLAKRIAVLYVCQLVIALVAVAAALAGGHRWLTLLLPVDGWIDGIWLSVTMQYLPSGGNILLLYMVLMVSAFALFPLLQRGWWAWTVAASLALYALSLVWSPGLVLRQRLPGGPPHPERGGWQIMFIPSVVIGWNWSRWRVPEFIDRWLVVIVAVAATVALFFHYGVDVGPWAHLEPAIADKLDFRPARAIGAYLAIPAIYGVFRLLLRWWHHDWLRPLVMTGTRSLDSYVIQAIALVVVPHSHRSPPVGHDHDAGRRATGLRHLLGVGGVPVFHPHRQTAQGPPGESCVASCHTVTQPSRVPSPTTPPLVSRPISNPECRPTISRNRQEHMHDQRDHPPVT